MQEARGRQDAPCGIKLSQNCPHDAVEAHLQDTRVAFMMGAPQGLAGKELSSGGRGFWETLSRLLPSSWPLSLLPLGNPPRLV